MVSADISPYTVVCQSQPGGNVFQCFGGRPIQADRFSIFSLLCLDIRFPSEVCTIPCRFANSGSCLCRYSLNVSGWSPNSLAAWAIGRGCFLRLPMAFSYLAATVFIRFSISANQDPLLPCWKVLPVPSLSRYAIVQIRTKSFRRDVCSFCDFF